MAIKLQIKPADGKPAVYSGEVTNLTFIPAMYSTFSLVGIYYDVVNIIHNHTGKPTALTGIDVIVRETFSAI